MNTLLSRAIARPNLWLLSRTPVVSEDIIVRFKARAGELGFDTDKLIFVDHG